MANNETKQQAQPQVDKSKDDMARLREQFAEQQKVMQQQARELEEMRAKAQAPKQERQAQVQNQKTPKPTTAGAETAEAAKVQDVRTGGKEAREASLKASEETNKQAREAEQAAIEAYRDDKFARDILQAKVEAGEVPPPADAPDEVRAKFRDSFESDRQARWEEHRQMQLQATKEHLDSLPQKQAKVADEPANVDAPKPQPSSGGPTAAAAGDNRSTGTQANISAGTPAR